MNKSFDFKNWMNKNSFGFPKKSKLIGTFVESKLAVKYIMEKITTEDENDLKKIAKSFKNNGGTVLEVYKDDMVLVETTAGQFTIHKYFLKKETI